MARSEPPAVEVVDIDEGHTKPNNAVRDSSSRQTVSGVEGNSVPQGATKEIHGLFLL